MAFRENMVRWMEPLQRYQVRFADFIDQRTPRERQMLAAMAIAIGLWMIYWTISGLLLGPMNDSRTRVAAREAALREMLILKSDYGRIQGQVGALERSIQAGPQGNVLSRRETMASQAQVKDKITSMDPKSAPPNDLYRENVIEIRLSNVNLKQLVDYLYRIENSNQLLKIKRLRIKVRNDDSQFLDVNFRVSSFEPLARGAQPVQAAGAAGAPGAL